MPRGQTTKAITPISSLLKFPVSNSEKAEVIAENYEEYFTPNEALKNNIEDYVNKTVHEFLNQPEN